MNNYIKYLTVRELKEQIVNLPDEMKVAVNCDISEDQDMATTTRVITQKDSFYAKGDNVWILCNLDSEEKILFIT